MYSYRCAQRRRAEDNERVERGALAGPADESGVRGAVSLQPQHQPLHLPPHGGRVPGDRRQQRVAGPEDPAPLPASGRAGRLRLRVRAAGHALPARPDRQGHAEGQGPEMCLLHRLLAGQRTFRYIR